MLRVTLGSGVTRVVLAMNCRGQRAVPIAEDMALANKLQNACAPVDFLLVDVLLLGDDGFCSLLRLGMLHADGRDQRHR